MISPPESLLEPCEKPEISKLETNDDLIRFASVAVLKWEQCAAKLNALRLFFGIDKTEVDLVKDGQVASEPH